MTRSSLPGLILDLSVTPTLFDLPEIMQVDTGAPPPPSSASVSSQLSGFMSEEEQSVRRKQIREIMCDASLSQMDKSRHIQGLMDGRRRSSCGGGSRSVCSSGSMGYPPAAIAAASYGSDEEGDALMSEHDSDRACDVEVIGRQLHPHADDRSISSEITNGSVYSNESEFHPQMPPPGVAYRQYHGRSYSLQDFNDNDRALAAASAGDGNSIFQDQAQICRLMEQSRPPCEHYERLCTIISPCCGLAFGCRICHDECPVLPAPFSQRPDIDMLGDRNKGSKAERRRSLPTDLMGGVHEEENHHLIDRFAIQEVICRECFTRQSSKT